MTEIVKGMVVELVSGGPPMSVVDVGDYGPLGPQHGAKCVWFDTKHNRFEDVFDIVVLKEHVKPKLSASLVRG